MYLVLGVHKNMGIKVNNCYPELKQDVVLSWADGMIGVCPVFDTLEEAEKYLEDDDGTEIIEIMAAE